MSEIQGYRLSPQQRWLWLVQGESPACRAQSTLAIDGHLDADALRRAVDQVVARHEILRTTFHRAPGVKVPIQAVAEHGTALWKAADLSSLDTGKRHAELTARQERLKQQPFDLERGPMLHAALFGLGDERHLLTLGLPGLCADRRTLRRLAREISEIYAGSATDAGEEPLQYLQYSEWQHALLDEGAEGRSFWRQQDLTPYHALRLPQEGPATTRSWHSAAPEAVAWNVEGDTLERLEERARAAGGDLAAALLALWQALLHRLSREPRVAVGEVLDGHTVAELDATLGSFARTVPVACDVAGELRFDDLLARVIAARATAAEWQDYFVPEDVFDPAATHGAPIGFELDRVPEPWTIGGLTFSEQGSDVVLDRFKVMLACTLIDGTLRAALRFNGRLFQRQDVERLVEKLDVLTHGVLDRPEVRLGDVEIVSAEERRRIMVDLNQTATEYPRDRCLHQLVAEQATHAGERTAVLAGDERMSFAELEQRANRLAHLLRARGVGPETTVGILLSRTPRLLEAILGVLKAGGAYLPLEPTYPRERLAWMLETSQPRLVLTERALAAGLPGGEVRWLELDDDPAAGQPATAPVETAGPDNLAYVMYTSGSTGRPKGVMVPHRGLVNYLTWCRGAYATGQGEGAPVHSPLGFDLTVTSLFSPLLAGSSVVLLSEEEGVTALSNALRAEADYSLVKLTPAHLELLHQTLDVETALAGRTRTLIVGGEALRAESLASWRQHAPETRLVNEYGPTETVVGSTAYTRVAAEAPVAGSVPIGRPIANTRAYVVDRQMQPVGFGEPGELLIGGDGVTRGYQRQPRDTAGRFVPDPFHDQRGGRLYRTGDLVRYLPDGDLEFLGRTDLQVKVRGFRVEPGEIETVLARHRLVREAVVVAHEESTGERRLVAYLVTGGDSQPDVEDLRRHLATELPEYMMPASFVPLPELPLNERGKVDRGALPAPSTSRPALHREYVAPRSPTEEVLAGIWQEVLGVERIGIHDGFFALGGDSIRSVRAVALAKEQGLEMAIPDLFRHQTVAELAEHVAADLGDLAAADDEEALARMLEEVEEMSEDAVKARLREKLGESAPEVAGT